MRSLAITLLFLGMLASCDEKPKPPPEPTPPPPGSALAVLGMDAGLLGDPVDPPAPAGDLKTELDRFVNVETCVTERAKLDPLVGDALGAIGYETFLRDACRLLEAAKDKKRETCDRIDSSALRARCQSWVAMVSQVPDSCPMQFEGLPARGRNASCVAIAAKDPRLCVGESRTVQRATCEALVMRDPAKCDTLLPNQKPLCQREVARWKSVLVSPLEGLPKLTDVRGKLTVRGASGTPDPPQPEVDVGPDFARGVVVVVEGEASPTARIGARSRVEMGTVVESEAARLAAGLQKKARVGLALIREGGKDTIKRAEAASSIQKLEVELPGDPPIVSPPSACECKITRANVDATRGGVAEIALEGTVSNSAGKTYRVTIDLTTFVRDIVPEGRSGPRLIPPIHPPLGGLSGRPDAGKR